MNSLHNSKIMYFVVSVGLFLLGALIGGFIDPYLPSSLSNSKKGYENGFTAARTVVEGSGLGSFFKTQTDVRSVSGTVTSTQGGRIGVHSQAMNNPFEKTALSEYSVLIDSSTKISKLVAIDPKLTKAQIDALIKAQDTRSGTKSVLSAMGPYIETTIPVSSIKTGDVITVTAGENIKSKNTFTATEIRIQPPMLLK